MTWTRFSARTRPRLDQRVPQSSLRIAESTSSETVREFWHGTGPRQVSSRRPRLLIGYLADVSHPNPAALLSQVRQSIAVAGDDLLDQTIELNTVLGME